ncbi:RtcB family protein [Candidatus Micrarchaeota archaeon]|nr:RtcB family protein [Candidatus Micrarchaeota archaeon]
MNVPVRAYAEEPLLEKMKRDKTFEQAKNVSTLPGIQKYSFVMPDGHEGYGFPIGGVAAFDLETGVVSPGGVGYDINCGVRLLRTNLTLKEVQPRIKDLVPALFEAIPSGVGSKGRIRLSISELEEAVSEGAEWAVNKGYGVKEDVEHCEENGHSLKADPSKASDTAKKRGAPQFGTLGSGNHFLEIQKVDKIFDEKIAKAFGIEAVDQITVMIHTGSRGYGHQVCDDYIRVMLEASRKYNIPLADKELCCAPLNSREAENYFGAMYSAMNYAFCNRQVMTHWTRETFQKVFGRNWDQLGLGLVYDVCHNIAKIEEHEVDGKRMKVCVHRKGATRAFWAGRQEIPDDYRLVGQPVIIAGSMGTASYLLCGLQTASETFGSTCHGAGRVMSRHEAIRTYRGKEVQEQLAQRGIIAKATEYEVLAEEASGAYKDVDAVVRSAEKGGISKIVARLVPLGVIKG